ncbi:MAG: DUF1398 domain-containing protein [Hyphomonadaceae bacterium]
MDKNLIQIAEKCRDGAEGGTMSFPEIVGLLMQSGFEGYTIDFRRNQATYYAASGESVELSTHDVGLPVAPAFDAGIVAAGVKEAQANAPGYTYKGFCRKVVAAGCAGYMVSFSGRRVIYFGRTAETHLELFPN